MVSLSHIQCRQSKTFLSELTHNYRRNLPTFYRYAAPAKRQVQTRTAVAFVVLAAGAALSLARKGLPLCPAYRTLLPECASLTKLFNVESTGVIVNGPYLSPELQMGA